MANVKVQVKITVEGDKPIKGKVVGSVVDPADIHRLQDQTNTLVNSLTVKARQQYGV